MGFTSTGDDITPGSDTDDESDLKPAERARRNRQRDRAGGAREAKTTPPTIGEWEGFFSRVLLKVITEYYITLAFRGVDEDALTDRELDRLAMTDEERQLISTPLAELSNKSRFMRKHGRMIVASGDAFNAFVVLGMWASRVNRIAAKHKPRVVKGQTVNGHNGQNAPSPNGTPSPTGATGGRFPEWFGGPIIPGSG